MVHLRSKFFSLDYFKDFILISSLSFTLLSVKRPSRKTIAIPTCHDNPRKRFHLKDTTKNSIKCMEISSLLNTDLGN